MNTATQQGIAIQRDRDEQRALSKIAERIAGQFPEVPTQQVVDSVQGHYQRFDGSRIRDFIPVLVERAVKADLAGEAAR